MKFIASPTDPTPFFGENGVSERLAVLKVTDSKDLEQKYHQLVQQLEDLPEHVPEIRETYVVAAPASRYRMVVRYRLYGPLPAPIPTI